MLDLVYFEVIGSVVEIEVIAAGKSIRELARLRRTYGRGRWRKLKGWATVRLADGTICGAELHWYEAHGIGKREMRIKHVVE
jgi:threonine dehydrogenase-like Zn-dependent dehydrogenase